MTDNDSGYYNYPAGAFTPGLRVELHPACDLWARGARFGNVVKAGRVRVTVDLDFRRTPVTLPRTYIKPVDGAP